MRPESGLCCIFQISLLIAYAPFPHAQPNGARSLDLTLQLPLLLTPCEATAAQSTPRCIYDIAVLTTYLYIICHVFCLRKVLHSLYNVSLPQSPTLRFERTVHSLSRFVAIVMEPIAVVGVGLRFPHDAVTPDTFWDLLMKRKCAASGWPKDRVNIASFRNSARQEPSSVCKESI
jgi:hypothetical protein